MLAALLALVTAYLRAESLATQWLAERQQSPQELAAPCNSTLHGDSRYTGCAPFYKQLKASNHCRYCKCKACDWCGTGYDTKPSAGTRLSSARATLPRNVPFA
eukprot:673324-Prymnesium_polylepis.1